MRIITDITRDDISASGSWKEWSYNPVEIALSRTLREIAPNFIGCCAKIDDSISKVVVYILGIGEFPDEDPDEVRKYKMCKLEITRFKCNAHLIPWLKDFKACFEDFNYPYQNADANRKRKSRMPVTSFELAVPNWLFKNDYLSDVKHMIKPCEWAKYGLRRNYIYEKSYNSRIDHIKFFKYKNSLFEKYSDGENVWFDGAFGGVLPMYDMPYSIRGHYDGDTKKLVFQASKSPYTFAVNSVFSVPNTEIEDCVDGLLFSLKDAGEHMAIIINMEDKPWEDGTFRAGIVFGGGDDLSEKFWPSHCS
jgi:hypothetical protein